MSDEPETCAFCSQDLTAEDQAFELHDRLRETCDEFRETLNCRHARIDELEIDNKRLIARNEDLEAVLEAADKYCDTNQGHDLLSLVCAVNAVKTTEQKP